MKERLSLIHDLIGVLQFFYRFKNTKTERYLLVIRRKDMLEDTSIEMKIEDVKTNIK